MKLVDIEPYKGKVIANHLYSGVTKIIEVDSLKEITEEEIVKPYLDKIAVKLGELIAENMENDNGLPIPNQYAYCYQEVLEFVDNLLTEKGADE